MSKVIISEDIPKTRTNFISNSANYYQPVGSTLGLTNVGTNGGPSYYGTYDQFGLAGQWTSPSTAGSYYTFYFSGSYNQDPDVYFDKVMIINNIIFRQARLDLGFIYGERFGQSARICSNINFNNIPDMVLVADINNPSDVEFHKKYSSTETPTSINYTYYIGKYLITVKNYLDFLNSTASTDIYQCYNECISSNNQNNPLIIRNGSIGSYTYSTDPNNYNLPFNLKYSNLARYCNWLHNNQPIGNQDTNTTEDGAYALNNMYSDNLFYYIYPSTTGNESYHMPLPTRQPNAKYWIPTVGEWYKAACYDPTLNNGTGGYWSIPTRSNTLPRRITNKNNNNDGIIYKFSVRS